MKSQSDLHQAVLRDQGGLCGVDTLQDCATLQSRVEHRGESFLTLELPALGQAFERALETGLLEFGELGISKSHSPSDSRPAFLHGFWKQVFNHECRLLPTPSIDAVRAIRQICHLHSKLKELPTPEKVEASLRQYLTTDKSISDVDVPSELYREFRETSRRIWGVHFSRMEKRLYRDSFLSRGKHGPGAVAQKLTSNGKWRSNEWTERLQSFFPAHEYLTYRGTTYDEFRLLPPGEEWPARVIPVPKTAKGPRIITAEPTYNQFVQQGLAALFEEWMDIHPRVSYVDQTRNQKLARQGSLDGSVATLDLSEASDRMSLTIVKFLLRDHPFLMGAVLSCRSSRSILPDGTIVLLKKFASMGSALTFPLETIVFYTIIEMAVRRVESRLQTEIDRSLCSAYGDDLIVPIAAANECAALLEAFGLKVNVNKSFVTGKFRESCGGDFYDGVPVNLVRLRKRLPRTRRNVDEVVSIVAFRNLYWEQYGETELVTLLDNFIKGIIPFPEGPKETAALVRWNYTYTPQGYDGKNQRPFVQACVPDYLIPEDMLDGEAALLKFFWTPFQEDRKHLQRAGRPVSATLKYRKVHL